MFKNLVEALRSAADKGILLLIATISSIIIANSNWNGIYNSIVYAKIPIRISSHIVHFSSHFIVNDFLMAIFFLVIGIEIKNELLKGHLSTNAQRVLPAVCAVGGVLVPMLIYILFNFRQPENLNGWAIPTATDIAFVIAIMSVFSKRIPTSIQVFVTALAVIDDFIAIAAIAIFYTKGLNLICMFGILACIMYLYYLNRQNVKSLTPYFIVGSIMFSFFCFSGIHATLAGVVLGFIIPIDSSKVIVKKLNPLVQCFIIPIFAFFNSGIHIGHLSSDDLMSPVFLGVVLGLFLGKQIGIFGAFYLLVKSKISALPANSTFKDVYIASVLCGIGFTMSIFVSSLAFDSNSIELVEAKLGILCGSLFAVLYGCLLLFYNSRSGVPAPRPEC